MALIWMDGFEDGMHAYSSTPGNTAVGRAGVGRSANLANGQPDMTLNLRNTDQSLGIVFAFYASNTTWGQRVVNLYGDAGSTLHCWLQTNTGGLLELVRGDSVSLGTFAAGFNANVWYHVEIRFKLGDTGVGECQVWVNGLDKGTVAADNKNGGTTAYVNRLMFPTNVVNDWRLDDLYVYNTSGTANNTFPLGDGTVEHLRPITDAGTPQWVRTGGPSNASCVDDDYSAADLAADNISSATVGNRDIYELTTSIRLSGTVTGVMAYFVGERSDTAARSAAPVLRDTTGTRVGTATALPYGSKTYGYEPYDRRNDGAAFTLTELAALGVGIDLTV
jgi:hypothetical protein